MTVKFLIPIYGMKSLRGDPLELESYVKLRNVDLLENEHELFSNFGLHANYNTLLDIDYSFDEEDSSEPYPAISLKLLNMIDASLAVYGEGRVGTAGIVPPASNTSRYTGQIISQARPLHQDYLNCTVLESILVPKREHSKKSFIVAGLKIMGYVAADIERIEKLIDYRNAIIHADRERLLRILVGSTYTLSWFEETFKLVRTILQKYIENP